MAQLPDLRGRVTMDWTQFNEAQSRAAVFGANLQRGVEGANSSFGVLNNHLGRMALNVGVASAAWGIYSAAAQGVGAAISGVVTQGVGFQDQMNLLQAVTDATAGQMQQLSDRAIALGNDLSLPNVSAADAADAMVELAKAGLSVSDTMAAAKGTLELAAAANVNTADAATYAATALNAFHLQGSEATRVADLLAAAANASAAEIGDVALAMQQSSAVFSAAHIPIQDLVAAIGEMANAGIRGSDAGTSLKQMLLQLEGATGPAKKQMQELGIAVYDSHGKMLPFRDLIAEIHDKTAKLTQAQRDQAFVTIFGSDATRAANVIFGQGVQVFDQMETAVQRQGAAADVAAARSRGLGGAVRGLQSEFETLQLQIFQKVAPGLELVVRTVAENFPAVQTAVLGFIDVVGHYLDSLSAPLQGALDAIANVKQALTDLGSPHVIPQPPPGPASPTIPEAAGGLTPGIGQGDLKTITWSDTAEEMGKNLADAIIRQAPRIGQALIKAVEDGMGSVDWEVVGQRVGAQSLPFMVGFVNHMFDGIVTLIREHPTEAIAFAITAAFTPTKIARPLIEVLNALPLRAFGLGLLLEGWNTLGNRLAGGVIEGILRGLRAGEGEWATGLGRLIIRAGEILGNIGPTVDRAMVRFGEAIGTGLRYPLSALQTFTRGIDFEATFWVERLGLAARDMGRNFGSLLQVGMREALTGVRLLVEGALDALRTRFGAAWTAIRSDLQPAWDAIWGWLAARWTSILATATERFGAVRTSIATRTAEAFADLRGAWDAIWGWLTARWNTIWSTANQWWTAIRTNLFSIGVQIRTDVVARWDQIWSDLLSRFNIIWSTANERWQAIRNVVVSWAQNMRDTLGGVWADVVGAGSKAANDLLTAIKGGLNSVMAAVEGFDKAVNSAFGGFLPFKLPESLPRFAGGGTVPGYAPGQDRVLALLSPGEGVLTPQATRMVGGAQGIDAINDTAQHFATGGVANPYPAGECTWGVYSMFPGMPVNGNAKDWISLPLAHAPGPAAGEIVVYSGALPGSQGYGHVARVDGPINAAGLFPVTETNYSVHHGWDTRMSSMAYVEGFLRPNVPGQPGGATGAPGLGIDLGGIIDNLVNTALGSLNVPGWIKGLPVAIFHGVADKIKSSLTYVGSAASGATAAVGGSVQAVLQAALAATGYPSSWLPALLQLSSRENASGNPSAINPTAVGGQHATGFLQMLPTTFLGHALPGHTNILSAVDNAISALRYIAGRYGSPANIPNLYGSGYVGYADGGLVVPGQLYRVGERGPEYFTSDTSGRIVPSGDGGRLQALLGEQNQLLRQVVGLLAHIDGAPSVGATTGRLTFGT